MYEQRFETQHNAARTAPASAMLRTTSPDASVMLIISPASRGVRFPSNAAKRLRRRYLTNPP